MTEQSSNKVNYVLMLFGSAVLWSTGGVFIKQLAYSASVIACLRSVGAVLVILAIYRKPFKYPSRTVLAGAIFLAATGTLFIYSTKLTTASNAIILQYTAPLYVALFGRFWLKEKAGMVDWLSMTALMGGAVLFFLGDLSGGKMLGNILALLSGVCFAGLTINLRMQKDQAPEDTILWGNIICGLVNFPFLFQQSFDYINTIGAVALGVFQLGLPYLLYSMALKKVRAIDGILIPILEPILNPLWVFLVLGERPGSWAIMGGTIVLTSLVLRGIWMSKQRWA